MSQESIIRSKILELVKKYYFTKTKDKFVPGKTYINYAGRVYDEKNLSVFEAKAWQY
ncbi:MAG: hypothetical protein WCY05_00080 [Candidatus Omnitrophota bacterium]